MDKELLEAIEKTFGEYQVSQAKAMEPVMATLNDTNAILKKLFKEDQKEAAEAEKPGKEVATVEDPGIAGTINQFTGFEFMNVPIGAAVVGGAIAVFGTELIDGVLAKQSLMIKGVAKLAGAGLLYAFGRKWIGTKAAGAVALLMTFDAIKNDLLPQPYAYMTQGANKLTGVVTSAGLGWTGGAPKRNNNNVVEQAELVLTSAQKMSMR